MLFDARQTLERVEETHNATRITTRRRGTNSMDELVGISFSRENENRAKNPCPVLFKDEKAA